MTTPGSPDAADGLPSTGDAAPSGALTRRELRRIRETGELSAIPDGVGGPGGSSAVPDGVGGPGGSLTLLDPPGPVAEEPSHPAELVPRDALEPEEGDAAEPTKRTSRAGRNLPVAIAVGLGLGAFVILGLFVLPKEFFGLFAYAMVVAAVIEMRAALQRARIDVPVAPILVGGAGMLVCAYLVGPAALLVAFVATAGASALWCVIDTPGRLALRNASASILTIAYIPFLASFFALALAQPNGAWWVLYTIVVAVGSDVGGYAAGVMLGKHPIAPTVSPKKSWEGLGGSLVLVAAVCSWLAWWKLDAPWWVGGVVGVVGVVAALLGDLSESLLKRDLGLKDMGSVLPGHGGILDRVDSMLIVAPVAVILLSLLVPA